MSKILEIFNLVSSWEERISWNDYFMSMAILAASRSPCDRLNVGCILVKDNRVISMGFNGFLPGAPHVSRVRDSHEQSTVHAEQNAVTDCAKRGVSCKGATVYITHFPCINCTKILVAAGITKIYYKYSYKNDLLVPLLLEDSKIKLRQII